MNTTSLATLGRRVDAAHIRATRATNALAHHRVHGHCRDHAGLARLVAAERDARAAFAAALDNYERAELQRLTSVQ